MKIADPFRPYLYAAVALAVAGLLWWAGDSLYDAGVAAERAVWVEAQAKATEKADAARRAAQAASDGARDAAAQEAQQASADTRAGTTETIETIRYVYRTQPAPACTPAPVPDGVRDALNAAYDAASAASRGLPAAAGP